jgi:hypothetical protein
MSDVRGQSFEFGIWNAECGKKKRGQSFEFGIWNAERKKEDRVLNSELGFIRSLLSVNNF